MNKIQKRRETSRLKQKKQIKTRLNIDQKEFKGNSYHPLRHFCDVCVEELKKNLR